MKLQWPIKRVAGKPGEKRETPVASQILAIYGMGRALWSSRDYATLTDAGYKNVAAVFGSIHLVTGGAAGIDWKVEKRTGKGKWERDDESDLWKILWKPNSREGKRRFIANALGYKLLAGNSYLWKSAIGSLPPQELWTLRPDRMEILTGNAKNLIAGYGYNTTGQPRTFKPEEILHIKEFNPTDDFYGLSRLEVGAKNIDIFNWSKEWNLKILQKDMRPPGAVVVEGALSKAQRQNMQDDLRRFQGPEAIDFGTAPIFEGGGKWENISIPPKDMDWLNSQKVNMRELCALFHVWSGLLGDTDNTTYSNQQEGRKGLYLEAIMPEMDEFRDELQTWLVPAFGDNLRLDYDRDSIEAIQEDRAKRYTYLAAADWISQNEKRAATGYEEVPEGEVILVPIGKIPIELSGEGRPAGGNGTGAEPATDEEKARARMFEILKRTGSPRLALGLPELPAAKALAELPAASRQVAAIVVGEAKRSFWIATPERKRALWDNFELRVKAKERALIPLALSFLKEQAGRARDAGPVGLDLKREADLYGRKMASAALELATTGLEAGQASTRGELYDLEKRKDPPAELNPEQAATVRTMVLKSGTKIAESTMELVLGLSSQAEAEGWTNEELTQRIWGDLKEFAPWRSRLIARTEMTKLENWGQLEGYKSAEFVERKGWLSAYAPDTREGHIMADQTYRENAIGLDDPFEIFNDSTGEFELLQFPGDPAGGPGNVCNCLCTTFPEILEIGGTE